MSDVTGDPQLAGPELAAHHADNSFELLWATRHDFEALGLQPEHLRTDLARLLDL